MANGNFSLCYFSPFIIAKVLIIIILSRVNDVDMTVFDIQFLLSLFQSVLFFGCYMLLMMIMKCILWVLGFWKRNEERWKRKKVVNYRLFFWIILNWIEKHKVSWAENWSVSSTWQSLCLADVVILYFIL